jgi:8-oxo-dGTP pyrophosphatase MutT (NUDIX family)
MTIEKIIKKTNNILAHKRYFNENVGCGIILKDNNGRIILGTRTDLPEEVLQRILNNNGELKWTNAGGGLERGESPIYCIMRELKEEFGIEAGKQTKHIEVIGYNDMYTMKNGIIKSKRDFTFITTLKEGTRVEDLIPQKGEIGEIKAFTKREILDMINNDKIYKVSKNSIIMAMKLGYL